MPQILEILREDQHIGVPVSLDKTTHTGKDAVGDINKKTGQAAEDIHKAAEKQPSVMERILMTGNHVKETCAGVVRQVKKATIG